MATALSGEFCLEVAVGELRPHSGSIKDSNLLGPASTAAAWLNWLIWLGRLVVLHRVAVLFTACCALIVTVSVHDAMLVVVNYEIIGEVERNPIGKWLIEAQGGEVWLFVVAKLAGTSLVCTVLVTLFRRRTRITLAAAVGIAIFQLVLVSYLSIA